MAPRCAPVASGASLGGARENGGGDVSWRRERCCNGKSYCHYCPLCCSALGVPAGVAVPRLRLPLKVSVLLRDGRQRSTSLHAKVLAPDDVTLHDLFDDADHVPHFDPKRTVVAFPSEDACTWSELEGLEDVREVVLLCSPWQQAHRLAALAQVSQLRCVRIGQTGYGSAFWRVPPHDAGAAGSHLATIEALVRLLQEFVDAKRGDANAGADTATAAAAAGTGSSGAGGSGAGGSGGDGAYRPSGELEQLLFFFELIRGTIQDRGSNGRCGPSGPFVREGREAFRATKVQKTRDPHGCSPSARQRYGKPLPQLQQVAPAPVAAGGAGPSGLAKANSAAGRPAEEPQPP